MPVPGKEKIQSSRNCGGAGATQPWSSHGRLVFHKALGRAISLTIQFRFLVSHALHSTEPTVILGLNVHSITSDKQKVSVSSLAEEKGKKREVVLLSPLFVYACAGPPSRAYSEKFRFKTTAGDTHHWPKGENRSASCFIQQLCRISARNY